jgi:heterodisulfide reductase subunit C/nitrate reductase gamma subunit
MVEGGVGMNSEIRRDTFWMISTELRILLYVLAAVTIFVFLFGFYRRFRLWRKGIREKVNWNEVKTNLVYFWNLGVRQTKVRKDRLYGYVHRFISYGFVILFIGTVLVVVDYDFHIPILRGSFYLIYEVVLDVFGLLFIIGLVAVLAIRAGKKRKRLKLGTMDSAFILLFLIIGVGGYILEAIRLSVTQIEHAVWSPVGYMLALMMKGSPLFGAQSYSIWWTTHAIFAFVLIAIIPYTKLFHFFTAPLLMIFQPVKRTGKIRFPYAAEEMTTELDRSIGVQNVYDFTSWQLLSTDACTECGRCDSQCPAHISGKPLKPRSIVTKIRDHMHQNTDILSFIQPEELNSCTTCGACVEACPVSINQIDLILSMRRGLILNKEIETEAENVLMNIEEQYNAWGKPWSQRADWSLGMNIPLAGQRTNIKKEET